MKKEEIVMTFPHLANYYVAFAFFVGNGLGVKCIVPPPISKKTIELGSKHAPDFVCSPFKINLGNFIEAIEAGANMILQTNGGCRVGYYGELQEQILKDLGYEFEFIKLPLNNKREMIKIYKEAKKKGIKTNVFKLGYYLLLTIKMIKKIDVFEEYVRSNIGFEVVDGSFDLISKEFLTELPNIRGFRGLRTTFKKYMKMVKAIPLKKPNNTLKVGVVGELFTLMDGFSNHFLEKELAKYGVEITRYVTADYLIFKSSQKAKKLLKDKNDYVQFDLGAGGTDSVVKSLDFAKNHYDGIIHVKASFCTPEINAMPIMQRISAYYEIPILYFSFDTATSDIGVKTRIEAFYDMLEMRRNK